MKYGVFNATRGRSERALIVIDKTGIVRWVKVYEPGHLPDVTELLDELKKLQ